MSTVEKFLSADPKPTWNGEELLVMSKCALIQSLLRFITNCDAQGKRTAK